MTNIIDRIDSEFFKKFNPYFDSKTTYNRKSDTIIYFAFKTPSGKITNKKWALLRFNSERNITNKVEKIENELNRLCNEVYKTEIKKGYSIFEIVLYSGEI